MARPPLLVLRPVPPAAFTERHFQQLQRLEPYMWDGRTALALARQVWKGEVLVWEVEGTDHAVVLTSVEAGPADPILWLDGLAGDGIMARGHAIVADLRTIAREYGCPRIRASSLRGAWDAAVQTLGFHQIATVYSMNVEEAQDGRIEADADQQD